MNHQVDARERHRERAAGRRVVRVHGQPLMVVDLDEAVGPEKAGIEAGPVSLADGDGVVEPEFESAAIHGDFGRIAESVVDPRLAARNLERHESRRAEVVNEKTVRGNARRLFDAGERAADRREQRVRAARRGNEQQDHDRAHGDPSEKTAAHGHEKTGRGCQAGPVSRGAWPRIWFGFRRAWQQRAGYTILAALSIISLAGEARAALTAHWPLNDNAASTTIVATLGTNGTYQGGANTQDRDTAGPGGSIPAALQFTGNPDYATLSIPARTTGAASYSIWFRATSSMVGHILGRTSDATNRLSVTDATTIRVRGNSGTNLPFTVPTLSVGQWYMLTVTFDTSNNCRVYINGAESSTGAQTMTDAFGPDIIARSQSNYFNCALAQFKCFDHTLSQGEIDALLDEGKPQNTVAPAITGTTQIGETVTRTTGTWSDGSETAIQWLVADDDSGTNAANISGETSSTYLIDDGDVDAGQYLAVEVTYTNGIGSMVKRSDWYGPITSSEGGVSPGAIYYYMTNQ